MLRYMSHTVKHKTASSVNSYGEAVNTYAAAVKFWGALIPTQSRYEADGTIYTLTEANLLFRYDAVAEGDIVDNAWTVDYIKETDGIDSCAVLVPLAK